MMNKYKDLVSIIIPLYNSEKTIEKTLCSILGQTYKNYEIILIDDHSSDNTVKVVEKFEMSNLKLIQLDINQGAANARNNGLALSQGRYIAFIDSDDTWHSEKLNYQIEFMKREKIGFSYTSINICNEACEIIKKNRRVIRNLTYKRLLRNTVVATSTVMIDREIIGDFRMPNYRSGQDYATWLLLLRKGQIAYGIDVALTNYTKSTYSLSSKKTQNYKKVFRIQVEQEKISKLGAAVNVVFYIINAIKKHYF